MGFFLLDWLQQPNRNTQKAGIISQTFKLFAVMQNAPICNFASMQLYNYEIMQK